MSKGQCRDSHLNEDHATRISHFQKCGTYSNHDSFRACPRYASGYGHLHILEWVHGSMVLRSASDIISVVPKEGPQLVDEIVIIKRGAVFDVCQGQAISVRGAYQDRNR